MTDVQDKIKNLRPRKTMSHFLSTQEMTAYLSGYKEARHEAAEIFADSSAPNTGETT